VIAPVTLSADALTDGCGQTGTRLAELHRRLTTLLIAHGQVVFADKDAEGYFREQVEALGRISPSAYKYWEGFLQYGRLAHAEMGGLPPVEQIVDLSDLLAAWGNVVDLAVMESDRIAVLGAPDGAAVWREPTSGLEIACHDSADASHTLGSLRQLDGRRTIRKGTDRERIWEQRMAPLVRASDRLHLLDRFLGESLDRFYREQDRPARRRHAAANELEWLLSRVAGAAGGATLSIYTRHPDDWQPSVVVKALERAVAGADLVGGGLVTVQLFLVPDRCWTPHDRHFRADRSGIGLSAGFDRLRQPQADRGFTLTYLYAGDVQLLADEEDDVRSRRQGPPTILL
jgi:hypothetical protein